MENEKTASTTERKCDGSGGLTRVAYDNSIGKGAAKVMRNGLYEGIYNVHSEACYVLTNSAKGILDEFDTRIANFVKCGSLVEVKEELKDFETRGYPKMIENLKGSLEEYNIVGLDTEPLMELLEKYKKLLIDRVSKGELPDRDYLEQQLDEFIEEFCADRTTDKTLSIIERFEKLVRGGNRREEREEEEDRGGQ